jgi:small-conductance mechanosensitive channel
MEVLQPWLEPIQRLLSFRLADFGATQFTVGTLLYILFLLFLLFYLTAKIRNWIVDRLLARTSLHIGVRQAVGTISRYVVLALGFLLILETAGIDLTTLTVLAGAVGIGLGFGLQNIASNFFSGLIILFERPIKIGDRIEVGGAEGDVIRIGARSTTVITNDNIAIIIPNSKFVSDNVVNWSYNDERVRFRIPVSVAYGSDVRLVEKLLLEVAKENQDVLDLPAPAVRFLEFGDSGLLFELRAWTTSLTHKKGMLVSALNFGIHDKFKENHIEIPYPQRDLHLRSGALELEPAGGLERIERSRAGD